MSFDQFPVQIVDASRYMAAAMAMGFGAVGAGMGEGYAAGEASVAAARQPRKSNDIIASMLIGQAIAESSANFALVIACLLIFMPPFTPGAENYWVIAAGSLSAGLCVGVGSIGAGFGMGVAAAGAVKAVARNPSQSSDINITMILGSAVAGNPGILALVISLLLVFYDYSQVKFSLPLMAALLGSGISMGFGAIGAGIGCGFPAASAPEGVGRKPFVKMAVTRTMLVGQAVATSVSIYALVIALLLLYK